MRLLQDVQSLCSLHYDVVARPTCTMFISKDLGNARLADVA